MGVGTFFTSKLDEAIGWARKYSIFQYPFVTACCGMEYMATACSHYDVDRFGAGLPRFSPRQADVLFVVGTISHKMAPVLKRIYDQMCEPKWVVAFGVCTCTGGFYDNYATVQGIDTIIPVDVYIPGCPPRPESVIDGLMKLQDKMDGTDILARLRERVGDRVLATHEYRGDHTAMVSREGLLPALTLCRDDAALAFDLLVDVTAVDYLRFPGREDGPRFEVVYHLYSVAHNHRVRVKVPVEQDDPVVPTATGLWPIANWLEREVWDMFGIRFEGHPDLRRLLMYEEFEGHPLRKDYPINRRQPLIGPKV
jgi:NADH-quinone oxidoreductase subunit B